eukprot:13848927-Ditylum_brightwellii.AAC.2
MISALTNIDNCTRTQPVAQQDAQQQELQNSPDFDDMIVIGDSADEEAESTVTIVGAGKMESPPPQA